VSHPKAIDQAHAGGFTLLELLVATAMMSILVLSLFETMRVAFRARDTALAAVGPARAGEAAMDVMRADLESALPPTGRLASTFIGATGTEVADTSGLVFSAVGNAAPGYLEGASGSGGMGATGGSGLTIGGNGGNAGYADNSDATLAGGTLRVAYAVRVTDAGTRVLVRQVQRNLLADVETGEADDESVVCRGVRTFQLRYFDGTQWLDTWDSSQTGNALPMAVEVTLELERPPTPGAVAVGQTAADLQPYSTTRIFFLSCYDAAAAAQATGGTP
jgi:prepilin-type N-terminal cleavage/methylation domain-containing protein